MGMTRPAIHKRVQNTEAGILLDYRVEISWEKMGFPLRHD